MGYMSLWGWLINICIEVGMEVKKMERKKLRQYLEGLTLKRIKPTKENKALRFIIAILCSVYTYCMLLLWLLMVSGG